MRREATVDSHPGRGSATEASADASKTAQMALVEGTGRFFITRKGSPIHRILGRWFLGLMLVSALVTLLIHVRHPQNRFLG